MQKIKLPGSEKATERKVMTFCMDIFIAQKTFKLEQTQIVTSVPFKVRTKICCVLVVTHVLQLHLRKKHNPFTLGWYAYLIYTPLTNDIGKKR